MSDNSTGTKQPTTSDMVIYSKLGSGRIPSTAGRPSRAVLNQVIANDTQVKVRVKREPRIDEFEGDELKRRNKKKETVSTVEEYLRRMNKTCPLRRTRGSRTGNEGETQTSSERLCAS